MRALAEIGATVQRAALGAGIPLAQAENLGRTAVFLAGTGGDLDVVVAALTASQDPMDVRWADDQITVVVGPAALVAPVVRDAFIMGVQRAVLPNAAQVPLVVAMLAQAGIGVRVEARTVVRDGTIEAAIPKGPVQVSEVTWAVFADFAARTYVPDSATSRAVGAGAGLTDND